MPKILCDMDEVLACCIQSWAKKINERHNLNIRKELLFGYDWIRNIPGLTSEECLVPIRTPGFFLNLPVIPGAQEAIQGMLDRQWEVIIVTSPPKESIYAYVEKKAWLARHFKMIDQKNIIFTDRKDLVIGDLLIDDSVPNIKAFHSHTCIFSAPYNLHYKDTDLRIGQNKRWEEEDIECLAALLE